MSVHGLKKIFLIRALSKASNFSPARLKRRLQNLLLRWKLTCLFNSNKLINSMLNRPESGRPYPVNCSLKTRSKQSDLAV